MSRVVHSVLGVLAAAILVGGGAGSAQAEPDGGRADGVVLVFVDEFTPTSRYENPAGCEKLPLRAHVLTNLTDGDVQVYGDPFCLSPSLTVPPNSGAHLAPATASFSA